MNHPLLQPIFQIVLILLSQNLRYSYFFQSRAHLQSFFHVLIAHHILTCHFFCNSVVQIDLFLLPCHFDTMCNYDCPGRSWLMPIGGMKSSFCYNISANTIVEYARFINTNNRIYKNESHKCIYDKYDSHDNPLFITAKIR